MKFALIIIFLTFFSGCGKKDSKGGGHISSSPLVESQSTDVFDFLLDTDGDGVSDNDEIKNGTDRFIADIPKLDNQLFKELSVKIEFYNRKTNKYLLESFVVKNDEVEFSWQKDKYKTSRGTIYMDTLLRSYATNSNFAKNGFRFRDYNEGIFSFSSPVLHEESLLNISRVILDKEREGYFVKQTQSKILVKVLVNSDRYKHFTQPVFDIYYKAKDRDDLVFVESQVIDGITYEFNKQVEIYFDFNSFDNALSDQALLAGGGNFFIKLRDFYIYENGVSYSSLLRQVKLKSVPVTVSFPDGANGSSKFETIYVGLQGGWSKMVNLLKTAFKNEILMTNSSIDVVRGFNNNRRAFGESGENETLRWYVGSSSVDDNIFSHNYEAGDGIGLTYLSDKKVLKQPLYISKSIVDNSNFRNNAEKLPSNTKNVKIIIEAKDYKIPVQFITLETLNNCPEAGNRVYNVTNMRYDYSLDSFYKAINDGVLQIFSQEGDVINARVRDLVESKLISKNVSGKTIEIVLSQKLIESLPKSDIQPIVQLTIKQYVTSINVGNHDLVADKCHVPSRREGGGGCPKCRKFIHQSYEIKNGSELQGVMTDFEDKLDLNFFVISY